MFIAPLPVELEEIRLPQNQSMTVYACWKPWMTQARQIQVVTGEPP